MTPTETLQHAWVARICDCLTNLNNSATLANSQRMDAYDTAQTVILERIATMMEAIVTILTTLEDVQCG